MGVSQEVKVDWKKEVIKFSEGERSKTYKVRAVGEEEGRVLKIRLKSNKPFEFEDEEKIKIKILREQQTLK